MSNFVNLITVGLKYFQHMSKNFSRAAQFLGNLKQLNMEQNCGAASKLGSALQHHKRVIFPLTKYLSTKGIMPRLTCQSRGIPDQVTRIINSGYSTNQIQGMIHGLKFQKVLVTFWTMIAKIY